MGYNVARNPIGTVPNVTLASDPGKELLPPDIERSRGTWRTG